MDDPSKLIQTLLPLVIFFIWILISAAANAKKKPYGGGKAPQPNPIPQGGSERTSESSQKTDDKKDDWTWSDETVYRDQGDSSQETMPLPETAEPERTVTATTVVATPVISSDMLQKAMSFAEEEGAITDEIASGPRRMSREHYLEIDISHKEMRKAMIWSEVLAPPLALRDQ
jgi:hypothetical protein